jgi:hypothetical protein
MYMRGWWVGLVGWLSRSLLLVVGGMDGWMDGGGDEREGQRG